MFPWIVTSVACCAVLEVAFNRPVTSFRDLINFAVDTLPDIFMVRYMGIAVSGKVMNVFTWTIHCMLLVELVMWGCLKFFRRTFTEFIVPVSIPVGLVLWSHYGNGWMGIMPLNTLRTWIAYCVGYECLLLSRKLAAVRFSRRGEALLTGLACLAHGLLLLGMFLNMTNMQYRWLTTYLGFSFLIAFSLSGHSLVNRWLSGSGLLRKISAVLGELSLPVYLMQDFVFVILRRACPDLQARYESKWVFVALLLGCSVLQWLIVPRLVKLFRLCKERTWRALVTDGR